MTARQFGYDYFDRPDGDGYRGYNRDGTGDGEYLPWPVARDFCLRHRIRTAADFGCAKGYLVAELCSAGIDAVGYDISDYALSFTSGLPCHHRDLREGLSHTVDAVFALGVLAYLNEDELDLILIALRCRTARFLLVSNFYLGAEQIVPDPLRRITRNRTWWRQQIERAGFRFDHQGDAFDVYAV